MLRHMFAGLLAWLALGSVAALAAEGEGEDRALKLDLLYGRLATADAESWEPIQDQIYAIWLDSGSDTADLIHARAREAMEAEDYQTALLHLDDLVRIAPGFAEGWNSRATVHFLLENYGAALADIHHVLALEPRHFGALAGLGVILDRLDQDAWALDAYRRVQAIHPHLPGAEEGIRLLAPRVDGQGI